MIAGFGVYGLTTGEQNFACRYKLIVGSDSGEEVEVPVLSSDVDQKTRMWRLIFEGEMVELQPGITFTIVMRLVSQTGQ